MVRMISAGSPLGRGTPGAPASRRRWGMAASAILHALALSALLLLTRRPPSIDEEAAPSYDLVFDNGASTPSTSPRPGEAAPPSPDRTESADQPPAPTPLAPPSDDTPPPAQPAPEPLPEPAPPPEPTPPQAAPQPAPEPLPDLSGADIRITPPAPPPPTPPLVPDLVLPPPPPLPTLPTPPVPRPAPRPQATPAPGTFANPMDLSFNQAPNRDRAPAPRTGAAPGSVASRSMDFSLGAPKSGPNRSEAFFDARARNLGADWMQGVHAFWLRHRYYPRQAAENGEDGNVDLELTVDRTGRVQSAVVTSRSGSAWIDMAAVGTFRGAQLPPIPEEVTAPYKTTITIHYVLIR